jgi:hypothetical protein
MGVRYSIRNKHWMKQKSSLWHLASHDFRYKERNFLRMKLQLRNELVITCRLVGPIVPLRGGDVRVRIMVRIMSGGMKAKYMDQNGIRCRLVYRFYIGILLLQHDLNEETLESNLHVQCVGSQSS